jgi:hypothetical protein
MPNYKPQREARYQWLRSKHFSPIEAREFSKLSRKYPALQKMVRQRASQWSAFDRRAKSSGWSEWKRGTEWVNYLKKFYGDERYKVKRDRKTGERSLELRPWVVHKDVHGKPTKPKPSPWEWYDSVFNRLPNEDKWDTPRSHRRRTPEPDLKVDRVMKQQFLDGLRRSIEEARRRGDTERVKQLEEQLRRLRRGGK